VVKAFGETRALNGVTLEIRPGELFFLLGASGCGKSTLLRCIAGLESPTCGAIHFGDRDVTAMAPHKREAAMVFQSYALWPHLTVAKNISFGLVCSTTERITRVLTHQDRIGFCSLDVWQGLDKEFFDRLRKLLGDKPAKLVPLKPRPHQKKAIADARKHFIVKKQKRGKLISPCGSGKSLTAYWIARDLKAKKILIAVPSLALIRQTLKVWLRESLAHGDTVEWICVCSDESAGRVEQDDVAVLRQDLGVPCLTDPKEIASWLKQKKPGLTVVFTTYQSGEALGKAARRAKFSFDLGIMDEAHKTVGDGAKLFSHLLHENNLPVKRRIFMTATERRYRGKGDKILSMDDPEVYGETFHLLTFKKAMEVVEGERPIL
jgi:predicted helicase